MEKCCCIILYYISFHIRALPSSKKMTLLDYRLHLVEITLQVERKVKVFLYAAPRRQSRISPAVAVSATGRPFLFDSNSHWAPFTRPPPTLHLQPWECNSFSTLLPGHYTTLVCSLNPSCSHFHKSHFVKILFVWTMWSELCLLLGLWLIQSVSLSLSFSLSHLLLSLLSLSLFLPHFPRHIELPRLTL